MSVKVKVQFDGDARMLKDRKKLTKCKKKLICQVIKDTTPYVPMQDGILYMSALVNQNRIKLFQFRITLFLFLIQFGAIRSTITYHLDELRLICKSLK